MSTKEQLTQQTVVQQRMSIPTRPTVLGQLESKATRPSDLDPLCWELGVPAHLLNFHLAFSLDLSQMDMGKGVFIPTQISQRSGGRRSALNLKTGERVLTGIFVADQGMALRYWTRETGTTTEAQVRDTYREEWTTRDGDILASGCGTLVEIDHSTGKGRVKMNLGFKLPPIECDCDGWIILWTAICWGDCKCKTVSKPTSVKED